jgi:hypothetical protein
MNDGPGRLNAAYVEMKATDILLITVVCMVGYN